MGVIDWNDKSINTTTNLMITLIRFDVAVNNYYRGFDITDFVSRQETKPYYWIIYENQRRIDK